MSVVIRLPDPPRLRAGVAAVRTRAARLNASPQHRALAIATLVRELDAGRSTAAAVALANGELRRGTTHATGATR